MRVPQAQANDSSLEQSISRNNDSKAQNLSAFQKVVMGAKGFLQDLFFNKTREYEQATQADYQMAEMGWEQAVQNGETYIAETEDGQTIEKYYDSGDIEGYKEYMDSWIQNNSKRGLFGSTKVLINDEYRRIDKEAWDNRIISRQYEMMVDQRKRRQQYEFRDISQLIESGASPLEVAAQLTKTTLELPEQEYLHSTALQNSYREASGKLFLDEQFITHMNTSGLKPNTHEAINHISKFLEGEMGEEHAAGLAEIYKQEGVIQDYTVGEYGHVSIRNFDGSINTMKEFAMSLGASQVAQGFQKQIALNELTNAAADAQYLRETMKGQNVGPEDMALLQSRQREIIHYQFKRYNDYALEDPDIAKALMQLQVTGIPGVQSGDAEIDLATSMATAKNNLAETLSEINSNTNDPIVRSQNSVRAVQSYYQTVEKYSQDILARSPSARAPDKWVDTVQEMVSYAQAQLEISFPYADVELKGYGDIEVFNPGGQDFVVPGYKRNVSWDIYTLLDKSGGSFDNILASMAENDMGDSFNTGFVQELQTISGEDRYENAFKALPMAWQNDGRMKEIIRSEMNQYEILTPRIFAETVRYAHMAVSEQEMSFNNVLRNRVGTGASDPSLLDGGITQGMSQIASRRNSALRNAPDGYQYRINDLASELSLTGPSRQIEFSQKFSEYAHTGEWDSVKDYFTKQIPSGANVKTDIDRINSSAVGAYRTLLHSNYNENAYTGAHATIANYLGLATGVMDDEALATVMDYAEFYRTPNNSLIMSVRHDNPATTDTEYNFVLRERAGEGGGIQIGIMQGRVQDAGILITDKTSERAPVRAGNIQTIVVGEELMSYQLEDVSRLRDMISGISSMIAQQDSALERAQSSAQVPKF